MLSLKSTQALPCPTLQARVASAAALGLTILLCSCAAEPLAPNAALGAASQAIATADRARITDAASPELTEARAKLAAANVAVSAKDMVRGDRLAREARVDAELATARTEATKAQGVNNEINSGTNALSTEMQRNSGAKP